MGYNFRFNFWNQETKKAKGWLGGQLKWKAYAYHSTLFSPIPTHLSFPLLDFERLTCSYTLLSVISNPNASCHPLYCRLHHHRIHQDLHLLLSSFRLCFNVCLSETESDHLIAPSPLMQRPPPQASNPVKRFTNAPSTFFYVSISLLEGFLFWSLFV